MRGNWGVQLDDEDKVLILDLIHRVRQIHAGTLMPGTEWCGENTALNRRVFGKRREGKVSFVQASFFHLHLLSRYFTSCVP